VSEGWIGSLAASAGAGESSCFVAEQDGFDARISVVLDGVEGSSTYGRVANAALRGSQGKGTPFDWEMAQLMQSGRLPSVSFYEGGVSVANPFG
jgi:hypothetical protein